MSRWCRSTEAALILGVSVSTVQRLAEAGLLPALPRLGGFASWWQFDRQELERLAGDAALTSLTSLTSSGADPDTLQCSGHEGGSTDDD